MEEEEEWRRRRDVLFFCFFFFLTEPQPVFVLPGMDSDRAHVHPVPAPQTDDGDRLTD